MPGGKLGGPAHFKPLPTESRFNGVLPAHFEAGLKKAHDVHHEKPVAESAKKVKATFDGLQAHMAGRRPTGTADQASPRPPREDNR